MFLGVALPQPRRQDRDDEYWSDHAREGDRLRRQLGWVAGDCRGSGGSQGVLEGLPACFSLCLRAVLAGSWVGLGAEGGGQGGGLPSWKRPCLIVPD